MSGMLICKKERLVRTDMVKDFESLMHTADLKIRVYGQTLSDLFHNALVGMFQSMGPEALGCKKENDRLICSFLPETHLVSVEAVDYESLLVNFLSEALYLSDVHNQAYLDVQIFSLDQKHIDAKLLGINVQAFEVVEIKAVTYHEMHIEKLDGLWQVDIVFDI